MSGSSVAAAKRRARRARLAWRTIPLTALLLLSLFAFFFITARVVHAILEVRNAEQIRNGAAVGVRPWMTVPYIARAYGVPEADLFNALGLAPTEQNRRTPLGALAKHNGRNLDADIATLNAVLTERHATPRAPAPPPPLSPGGTP